MHCDHSHAAARLIRGPGWGPGAPIGRIGLHPGPGAASEALQALSSCWGAGGEALQSLLFSSGRPSGAPTLEPAQPFQAQLGFHQDRISHRWPAWCPRRPRSPLGGLGLPPWGPVQCPVSRSRYAGARETAFFLVFSCLFAPARFYRGNRWNSAFFRVNSAFFRVNSAFFRVLSTEILPN